MKSTNIDHIVIETISGVNYINVMYKSNAWKCYSDDETAVLYTSGVSATPKTVKRFMEEYPELVEDRTTATAEAAEKEGETNTMITKTEYRAMFTEDRDAARETVKAWRNAVEALDRIQTEDLIAEETPAHTVSLFVNEVGENLARFVIASLINASAWDGRIYSNVAEWAKGQHSLDEEATQDAMLFSRMHKAHLNQIGEAMMKYQPTTTEEAQEATTEATEATEKEEEQNTMTSTERLTKDNKHSVKAGDELLFSNGDCYIIDTVNDTGKCVWFTLTDKRDGKRIYFHPSSECYGAEIIRSAV